MDGVAVVLTAHPMKSVADWEVWLGFGEPTNVGCSFRKRFRIMLTWKTAGRLVLVYDANGPGLDKATRCVIQVEIMDTMEKSWPVLVKYW